MPPQPCRRGPRYRRCRGAGRRTLPPRRANHRPRHTAARCWRYCGSRKLARDRRRWSEPERHGSRSSFDPRRADFCFACEAFVKPAIALELLAKALITSMASATSTSMPRRSSAAGRLPSPTCLKYHHRSDNWTCPGREFGSAGLSRLPPIRTHCGLSATVAAVCRRPRPAPRDFGFDRRTASCERIGATSRRRRPAPSPASRPRAVVHASSDGDNDVHATHHEGGGLVAVGAVDDPSRVGSEQAQEVGACRANSTKRTSEAS